MRTFEDRMTQALIPFRAEAVPVSGKLAITNLRLFTQATDAAKLSGKPR